MIANLRERFVPVAVDQHVHRRLKDEEGALFASVLEQAGRDLGGRSQGVYIFDPAGKLLAFGNTADAGHVKRLMAKALETFDPASLDGEFAAAPGEPGAAARPDGTLVALVTCKVLGGYEKVEGQRSGMHAASLGEDHLWIRADEAAALAEGVVPDALLRRLVRYHLVDNTRGEPPFWREDEVKQARLGLKDGLLEGHVELATADGSRGFVADLLGRVEAADGTLSRLDLVAAGSFHGEGTYTRGAPPGKYPFAVAVRLITPRFAADHVVPGAARAGVDAYLR